MKRIRTTRMQLRSTTLVVARSARRWMGAAATPVLGAGRVPTASVQAGRVEENDATRQAAVPPTGESRQARGRRIRFRTPMAWLSTIRSGTRSERFGREQHNTRSAGPRAGLLSVLLLFMSAGGTACFNDNPASASSERPSPVWAGKSASGLRAELRPAAERVRINQDQDWILTLLGSDGAPLYPARARVDGGMPQHGHGLPTRPRVTRYLGEGRYRVEGLRFNMGGAWTLQIHVDGPVGPEVVRLNLEINP